MADFCMPSLGADMDEGTILEWRVAPGSVVQKGDIVALVDTEKSEIEIEMFHDGRIDEIVVLVGETVPVGAVLARYSAEGAPVSAGFARASPRARAMAAERGIDLAELAGSGPGGAVVTADLDQPVEAEAPKSMRHAIATVMSRSKAEIPHYYLSHEVDLAAAEAFREQTNASRAVTERLLPAALLLKASAVAASQFEDMNGLYQHGEYRPASGVNLGVAISLRSGGLVAPAIHAADDCSLDQIMERLRDVVARARAGRLRSSEIADPTITVTNLGDQGVDAVQAVIYPPQVAMIGFGAIRERPVAVDGEVAIRPSVVASLAADHRVSDGLRGARFLATIDRLLQEPEQL